MSKKKNIFYEVKDIKKLKLGKKRIEENRHYISPKERPSWCINQNRKRIPQFRCLCWGNNKKCPFFAMANANKSDYMYLGRKYQ